LDRFQKQKQNKTKQKTVKQIIGKKKEKKKNKHRETWLFFTLFTHLFLFTETKGRTWQNYLMQMVLRIWNKLPLLGVSEEHTCVQITGDLLLW